MIGSRRPRFQIVGKGYSDAALLPASAVSCEVRGDAEKRVAPMRLALVIRCSAIEAIKRFLQEIIRLMRIAGQPDEVRPDRTRRPIVKGAEALLIHPSRHRAALRLAFDVGMRRLWHRQTNGHRSNHDTHCCHSPNRFESA